MMSGPLRIVIADDHPTFRSGLRAIVEAEPDLLLVGEAESGEEAVRLAVADSPDVVVMDLLMPGIGGVIATEQIVKSTSCHVVVVSMSDNERTIAAALRAGARGYLLKDASPDAILSAIRAAGSGAAVLGPAVAATLGALLEASHESVPFPNLSEREREVLDLLARGRTNHEIAAVLSLSDKTVRNYTSNVFTKLAVTSRAEAVAVARDAGIASSPAARTPYQTEDVTP